jgi:hypothetical protein
MKIERIERKEKDSIGHQVLVLVLAFLEAVITVFLVYYAVVVMDTTMVGRLMLTGLLVLAVLFWALEKGYLDYERVHALE